MHYIVGSMVRFAALELAVHRLWSPLALVAEQSRERPLHLYSLAVEFWVAVIVGLGV